MHRFGVARPFYTPSRGDASAFPPVVAPWAVAIGAAGRYVLGP